MTQAGGRNWGDVFLFGVALGIPTLLVFNTGPAPSFYNQAATIALWGVVIYVQATFSSPEMRCQAASAWNDGQRVFTVLFSLTLVSAFLTALPWTIVSTSAGVIAAALLTISSVGKRPLLCAGIALCAAIAAVALLNCLPSLVEAFYPAWVDDRWVAVAWGPDRISGNMRQPNLLATMCALGIAAISALLELAVVPLVLTLCAIGLLSLSVALTGSRVGLAELALIAIAGVSQPSLNRSTRKLMCAATFMSLVFWGGLQAWSHFSGALHSRPAELASGRYVMWQQCLHLIAMHPWLGVGFGNFNFAWTLTPFDRSNPETFDHAHNLILQWAVEFGIPMTALLVGLLGASFWRCVRLALQATGADAVVRRFCLLMVALVLLHSMTEYPLWYAYFLLPTVFAWGISAAPISIPADLTDVPVSVDRKPTTNWLGIGGLFMALGAAFAVYDYQKIVTIWHPYDNSPIGQRVAEGRKSVLYSHLADRFAGTLAVNGTRTLEPFKTATRQLLDMRLLIAWSLAMRETGHLDKARYLAQRVKDFNDPVSKQFFEKCIQSDGSTERPWQCTPPTGHYTYEDFL